MALGYFSLLLPSRYAKICMHAKLLCVCTSKCIFMLQDIKLDLPALLSEQHIMVTVSS